MTRKHPNDEDVSRVVVSNVIDPVSVAVDSNVGRIYWGTDDASNPKIEMSTLEGEQRMTLAQYPSISPIQCLTHDPSHNALYFIHQSQDRTKTLLRRLDLSNRQINDVRPLEGREYSAIAAQGDYIYLLYDDNLELIILNKLGEEIFRHVIDAIPHDIIVSGDPSTSNGKPPTECDSLNCGDFCISLGTGNSARVNAKCLCRDKYYFELDQKSCTSSEARYIYSVDGELWNAEAEVPPPYSFGEATLTPIARDYIQIEAIGYNYKKDLVYFSDTKKEALYRGTVEKEFFFEHTVNEYNIQGVSVSWLSDTVYWADADLRHIMLSKLDGRYHKVLLENVGLPKGLTVDAVNGYLYFVDYEQKSIRRAKTDGSNVQTIVDGLVQPHSIVADPRGGRIFYADGNLVLSSDLEGGNSKTEMSLDQPPFGISLWQEYLTWTEFNNPPQFARYAYNQPITMGYQPQFAHVSSAKSYAIVSYNDYLQPSVIGPCLDNGGCQQLCFPLADDHACGCAIGYTLDADRKTCNTEVAEMNYILFMDPYHKALYQLDVDNSMRTNAVPIDNMDFPIAFDLDGSTGRIYWIDVIKNSIRSSYTNGLEEQVVWTFVQGHKPVKLVYDSDSKSVFFLDETMQGLYKVGGDGDTPQRLVSNIARPSALAFNPSKRLLYFADLGMTPTESRIGVVSTDGSGETVIEKDNVYKPTGLAVHVEDNVLYWCDGVYQTIYTYDIISKGITSFSVGNNGQDMLSLTVDDSHLYFTTRTKKSVFRVSRNSTSAVEADVVGQPIFARITDIKAYPGVRLVPPIPVGGGGDGGIPLIWIIAGVIAAVILALLLLLLFLCLARKKKKVPPGHGGAPVAGFDEEVEWETMGMSNSTIPGPAVMAHNGHINSNTNMEVEYVNSPSNGTLTANGGSNGSNGRLVSSTPDLNNGIHDPMTDLAAGAAVVISTGALKKTKRYDKNSKRMPRNDANGFEMEGGKVATVIQRIAKRLRTGIDSIRWKGDSDGRSSLGQSSQPPPDVTNDGEPKAEDVNGGKNYAKNKPQLGPIRPQLHRLPQGFAPASRVTPSNVKTTFGRIKHS